MTPSPLPLSYPFHTHTHTHTHIHTCTLQEEELKAVKVTDMQDVAVKEKLGEVLDNFLENLG